MANTAGRTLPPERPKNVLTVAVAIARHAPAETDTIGDFPCPVCLTGTLSYAIVGSTCAVAARWLDRWLCLFYFVKGGPGTMIQFKAGEHAISQGQTVFEVWIDGRFIASIYAAQDETSRARISLVTKHGIDVNVENDALTSTAIIVITERPQ